MNASAMRKMSENSEHSPVEREFKRVLEMMKEEARQGYFETSASINSKAYREVYTRLVRLGYSIHVITAGTPVNNFYVRISW